MPPESVTIAAARRIRGTQSGAVMWVTRTSPAPSRAASDSSATSRTTPVALPGAAPRPRSSGSPCGAPVSAGGVPPTDVTGRDCSMKTSPSASKAHSVSCGAP